MKWTKKLTKKELRHVAETSPDGRATIRALRENLKSQNAIGALRCFECEHIARKLGLTL